MAGALNTTSSRAPSWVLQVLLALLVPAATGVATVLAFAGTYRFNRGT